MKLITLALFALPIAAQLTVAPGSVSTLPGQAVNVPITLTGPGASAIQWDQISTAPWLLVKPEGLVPGKTLDCNAASPTQTANTRCTLAGLNDGAPENATLIPEGPIARMVVTPPPGTAPGNYTLSISGVVAGSPGGGKVTATGVVVVGTATIGVPLGIYDTNGDGKISLIDLEEILVRIRTKVACTDAACDGPVWSVVEYVRANSRWAAGL